MDKIKTIFREVLGWVVALTLTPIIAFILYKICLWEKIKYRRRRY